METVSAFIFVVDDEPLVGELVEAVLEMAGYRIRRFTSPLVVLQALQAGDERPNLLLTDYTMPGLNGMELIQKVRAIDPAIRSVLFSGNVEEDILEKYVCKPLRFIRKPFYPQTLTTAIAEALTHDGVEA